MRDGFAIAGDDFALRETLREAIARRNRPRRRRRDLGPCRRNARPRRFEAMRRGFEPGRHQWQKIGLRVSLMAERFQVGDGGFAVMLGDR
ncbi:MAG: hypothetical protein JO093_18810 [Acidobacteria bacterium]|nr:hypothetical protein [Acidobacteriota bacterium]MBV9069431.1 hypothetical protein [Acidobacteriota bacterium]MBV9187675.1 hypothetical protein [Acidobacteriota bacterium]